MSDVSPVIPSLVGSSSRRHFIKVLGLGTAASLVSRGEARQKSESMNILLFYVDDLRPQLACYGVTGMNTPHLDRLAAEGTLFERAYSQYPVCGPSRASLLSGLPPTADRYNVWNVRVEDDTPDVLTLPQHFKNHGYLTQSVGKVFHDVDDCEDAWSEGSWIPPKVLGGSPGSYAIEANRTISEEEGRGPAYESADVEDSAYGDAMIAERACEELARLSKTGKPFFLAAGFLRPHLPFCSPKQYWDLYDRNNLPIAAPGEPPIDVPKAALHNWQELRNYLGMPAEGPLDEETAKTLAHGYCAAVSYMDAQIGRVLAELKRLGLQENTLVALVADHGMQLGEHSLWAKHCLFETSLHCPLIMSGPGIPEGKRISGLAEYLDVYPTLCQAAGLEIPPHTRGKSLIPRLGKDEGSTYVFSRHANSESVKSDTHRYSEFRNDSGEITARMLYNHEADPGENINIAEDPRSAEIVKVLSSQIAERIAQG